MDIKIACGTGLSELDNAVIELLSRSDVWLSPTEVAEKLNCNEDQASRSLQKIKSRMKMYEERQNML